MAQYHYVVWYDTADEQWHTDYDTTRMLLPDGEVFGYAGKAEWSPLEPEDVLPYVTHIADLLGLEIYSQK